MASWAEKKRKRDESKKLGRPLKEGVREPNGRISRTGIRHEEANRVAIRARMRQLGITENQAMDQKAGSFIGYLALLGPDDGLSEIQYQAAVAFHELYLQYQRAMKAPGAQYDPYAVGGEGMDPDAYAEWAKGVLEKFDSARKTVMEAQFQNKSENLLAAADYVLMRDQPVHNLIGATRILCNNLVRHFKIGENRRAAA